ncbi:MAG TPA: type VI secretion system tube protein Hcp [Polyangiaceae bacterium]|jgi:type VI secretion system secreted protein Hcp|nr:type VI secretion system tube protein Hcp [Polyangiaceae bacterium]
MRNWIKPLICATLITTTAVATLPALASQNAFLKIDEIKGEVTVKGHESDVAILAWSWGVTGGKISATGSATGKVNLQALSVTKLVDKSSAPLLSAVLTGKHLKTLQLTIQKAGEMPVDYLKITLEDVLVSSISLGGSAGDDRATESVTFTFRKVTFAYVPQNLKGGTEAAITTTYEVAKTE